MKKHSSPEVFVVIHVHCTVLLYVLKILFENLNLKLLRILAYLNNLYYITDLLALTESSATSWNKCCSVLYDIIWG